MNGDAQGTLEDLVLRCPSCYVRAAAARVSPCTVDTSDLPQICASQASLQVNKSGWQRWLNRLSEHNTLLSGTYSTNKTSFQASHIEFFHGGNKSDQKLKLQMSHCLHQTLITTPSAPP